MKTPPESATLRMPERRAIWMETSQTAFAAAPCREAVECGAHHRCRVKLNNLVDGMFANATPALPSLLVRRGNRLFVQGKAIVGAIRPIVGAPRVISAKHSPRRGFEHDGWLALVRSVQADAEHGRHGIEQAAHAGGQRAVEPSLDHGGGNRAFGFTEALSKHARSWMVEQFTGVQQRERIAPRVAHGCHSGWEPPGF